MGQLDLNKHYLDLAKQDAEEMAVPDLEHAIREEIQVAQADEIYCERTRLRARLRAITYDMVLSQKQQYIERYA